MKILVVGPLSSTSTDSAFWRRSKDGNFTFEWIMDYVFFSWSFLELLHKALLCNFLYCTAASGPYLLTNKKGLILHEQNIDYGKIFKWWNHGSHCAD